MDQRSFVRCKALVFFLPLAACTGVVRTQVVEDSAQGGADQSRPSGGASGATDGTAISPGPRETAAPARLRRLSPSEIRNSLRDLFLPGEAVAFDLPDEYLPHAFDNQLENLTISVDFMAALQSGAELVAASAVAKLDSIFTCDVAKQGERACATAFVNRFGRLVYRRTLTDTDRKILLDVYTEARKLSDHPTSIGTTIEAMVLSPDFLFRTELGAPGARRGEARLTGEETASLLSYMLWHSTPDEELLDAGAQGKLETSKEIHTQVSRMLARPAARQGMRDFFSQFLELKAPNALNKPDTAWTPKLAQSMQNEAESLFERVFWSNAATVNELFTSRSSEVNDELAKLYGTNVAAGDKPTMVALDPARRAGFLTQPAFLAAHTPGKGFSPISLGLFVRRRLFCAPLPPAPSSVPDLPREPNLTTRERFAQHSSNAACSACHKLMDPVGFSFERYDPLGRYHESEVVAGKMVPLTGQGQLEQTDVDGPLDGPVTLATRAAASEQVKSCFAAHMLEYGLGRALAAPEQRFGLDDEAIDAGLNAKTLPAMVTALVTSDAFVLRDNSALPGVQK